MSKFVKLMDGSISNAGNFQYRINEVNIANNWNPSASDPKEMGGFNFGTEDKILRWLHRGDTIYDVVIPEDAEVVLCSKEKGVYRTNKIVVKNPKPLTDELIVELYKKTSLSNKIIAQCLVILLWKDKKEISKYIIKDRINKENVEEILLEFESYAGENNLNWKDGKEIRNILKEIKNKYNENVYSN